jgi:ABC-type multidrug transport system ATPase subunit
MASDEKSSVDTSTLPSHDKINTSQPINQDELARVATLVSDLPEPECTLQISLQRRQSLKNVQQNDSRLDPSSQDFDFPSWVRKFMGELEQGGHQLGRTGFCFRDLDVFGTGDAVKLQKSIMSDFAAPFRFREYLRRQPEKHILRGLHGNVRSGEMLIVLGRPGAGCSTFLRSISGELQNVRLPESAKITYDGVCQDAFLKEFKGEVVYNQETEKHFPHLTVGEKLEFAAACRTPSKRLFNASRKQFAEHMTAVIMKVFGLSHTKNTKVGNDFIRGVSGGERKRVSLAEMALAGSSVAMWDNSSRGLDSSTALEFVRSLRIGSDISGMTQAVAIYQASQAIYDLFDKALILYEGRQIYFGAADQARGYFEQMGYQCPPRQTTADFLTAVTNPKERIVREGFQMRVPRTPDEFARHWQLSDEYKTCLRYIQNTEKEFGEGHDSLNTFRKYHQEIHAKHTRAKSPYIISVPMQIRLCIKRAYQRIWNDKASTISTIGGQIIQALIVGSIFYGAAESTSSFYSRSSAAFFAVLLSGLQSIVEINSLYEQRPIVSKHQSFAFYHPWTEAAAGILSDIPLKLVGNGLFLLILYFLAGLRAEAAQFFIFFMFCFVAMLTMSMIFRTVAAATKTMSQAFAIAGVLVLWIAVYTGFAIQKAYMHPWFKWSLWINPVAYAYEGILVNEVHGRNFPCAATSLVPPYGTGENFQCAVPGATAGASTVSGDAWVQSSYGYNYAHIWRNLGILLAFMVFFLLTYLVATEYNFDVGSTAEVLVFRRGKIPAGIEDKTTADEENVASERAKDVTLATSEATDDKSEEAKAIPAQNGVFTWKDVMLDIEIKGQKRRILDGVSGWVKPGTLTALMGSSGAGKTTLCKDLHLFSFPAPPLCLLSLDPNSRMLIPHTCSGCSFSQNSFRCSHRGHVCQRETTRHFLPSKDRVCSAAGPSSRNHYSP